MSDLQDEVSDQDEDEEVSITVLPQNTSDRVIEKEYEQGRYNFFRWKMMIYSS